MGQKRRVAGLVRFLKRYRGSVTEVPETEIRRQFDLLVESHRQDNGETSYDEPSFFEFKLALAEPRNSLVTIEGDYYAATDST